MPIYEYQCEKCCAIITEIRSVDKRDDESECLKCGGKFKRLPSIPQDPRGGPTPKFYRR